MKLTTLRQNNQDVPVLFRDDQFYDLSSLFGSIKEIVERGEESLEKIRGAKLKEFNTKGCFEYQSVIKYPNKLLCVAGNYHEHIKEGGGDSAKQPEFTQAPWLFLVPPTTTMIGHEQPVQVPMKWNELDYEGELAFVIGKHAKHVKAADAMDHVFGYTIFNDVSERKPFMIEGIENPRQLSFWYKKSFDSFGPTGPFLVTKDEIPDPQKLEIIVSVNGEEKQRCNTSLMIFGVAKLIEFVSSFLTLEPGDMISTGTPAGVGMGSGQFMKPGDKMEVYIKEIGLLSNTLTE